MKSHVLSVRLFLIIAFIAVCTSLLPLGMGKYVHAYCTYIHLGMGKYVHAYCTYVH